MPTEEETRQLLAKAAGTIDVDETAPMTLTGLPEPSHRRWPVLAAAAAVALVIGGGFLVTEQLGADYQPAVPIDQTDAADREPVEQEHVYDDDEMPSLLGYTREDAVQLLEGRGYEAEVRKAYSCDQPAGYVLGTDPGPGTPLSVGDTATVRVTGGIPPNVRCAVATDEWQQVFDLARFARGLGPAPDFPDEVSIAVGEGRHVELTAAEAADPGNWVLCDEGECHSALAALEQILTVPEEMNGSFASTFLVVTDELPVMDIVREPTCLTPDPYDQALPYRAPTYVYVDYPKDGVWLCPPAPVVQVGWTEDYRIASVRLRLAVETETIDEEELEGSLDRLSAARKFVTWARGEGPAPEFADRVRVMFGGGGAVGHTGWTDEPEDRARYSGCSGLGFPDCGLDPVALLFRYDGHVVPTAGRSTCAEGGEVPEQFAASEEDVVRLEEPEPESCRSPWAVELWIDEEGVIYGVNQAGGPA